MRTVKGNQILASPSIDEEGSLHLDDCFNAVVPGIRRLADLADVWCDPGALTADGVAYRMYRGVCRPEDQWLFDRHGLRYDITVIRPGSVGGEYIKTYGHHHPAPFPGGPSYPEVYEVLSGRGCFLMQRANRSGALQDVYVVEGRPGQQVVIPPDYGHVTVNVGDGWLILANLVSRGWESTYAAYRANRGAAYYVMAGSQGPAFVPNLHYGVVPPLKRCEPGGLEALGVREEGPLYEAFLMNPDAFAFLTHPERLQNVFDRPGWCR